MRPFFRGFSVVEVEVVCGIIGYGLLLSRYGRDGATNTVLVATSFCFLILVVVVTEVVVVTIVVLLVVVTSKVTGRSLVSMMLVEEMDELRNLEVISLTFRVLLGVFCSAVVVKTFVTVGLGVIGILLVEADF